MLVHLVVDVKSFFYSVFRLFSYFIYLFSSSTILARMTTFVFSFIGVSCDVMLCTYCGYIIMYIHIVERVCMYVCMYGISSILYWYVLCTDWVAGHILCVLSV